ncbi:MerR family transcriptional regulator [Micromonospora sp. NPDC006766]|uniref:MerR family transcriptional regulator n=1 Tax=Micromonospora sp. NPDC006766 TaxID=3154778 RepID=UPI0033E0E6D0
MANAMRISKLSARSGVPVSTIKFYLRERLLPQGASTAPNQAAYSHEHLLWLRLIRVLTGMGRLSISAVRDVLRALDDRAVSALELYGAVSRGMESRPASPTSSAAQARVDALLERCGWHVEPDEHQRDILAEAVALLDDADLDALAAIAEQTGARLLELLPWRMAESSTRPLDRAVFVARLVTLDAAFDALRRLAIRAPQAACAAPQPCARSSPAHPQRAAQHPYDDARPEQ